MRAQGWNITTLARPYSPAGVNAPGAVGDLGGLGRTRYWVLESQTPTVVGCGFNQQDQPVQQTAADCCCVVAGVW